MLFIKNTQKVPTISLTPSMSLSNDEDTTNSDYFNKLIQMMNNSITNNSISFTTGVYNQEPVTYTHLFTLFVIQIAPQYTCS